MPREEGGVTPGEISVELVPLDRAGEDFPLERALFALDDELAGLSSQADATDYLVAISSGILCGMADVLWMQDFDLGRGRDEASRQMENLVIGLARKLGCTSDELTSCVRFLEKAFPLAADGNTPDFGGGRQHHLRDFSHHPTVIGWIFSLITQFTGMTCGTDTAGAFICVPVPEKSRCYLGSDVASKIVYGTIGWLFHLASDMAGSSSSAATSGGTGIPGPVLATAKELSTLPLFRNVQINDMPVSVFLSKLFNGTFLAQHDDAGRIVAGTQQPLDLRGELGIASELTRQATPIVANECVVRTFYLVRRLAGQLREKHIETLADLQRVDAAAIRPSDNPTVSRMLAVSAAVFTTVDVAEAVCTRGVGCWVAINYVGVGRFAVAIGTETMWFLRRRDIKRLRAMYETMRRNTFDVVDNNIYERIGATMDAEGFGLTLEQTEILYNLERAKTLNDIATTSAPRGVQATKALKREWLREWQSCMEDNLAGFTGVPGAAITWYDDEQLVRRIGEMSPEGIWFRLALLEAMLFEPYYALGTHRDKKGREVPDKTYNDLHGPLVGYRQKSGDAFLHGLFDGRPYYPDGYIKRLRSCYGKVKKELGEVQKSTIKALGTGAGIAVAVVAITGAFAPAIAVALVGSNFAGLSGAALTSACLAYLGGGAIAAGGAGMAGGTIAIIGGGTMLGLGVGAGASGAVKAASLQGKEGTILQSSKLLVAVREVFLNDEHDLAYSNTVYEQFTQQVVLIENDLVELEVRSEGMSGTEKRQKQEEVRRARQSLEVMRIAQKSLRRFISSFETGAAAVQDE